MKEASPPVSAMATPTNGSGNLVDELEEAFQHSLNVLTKEEAIPNTDKDEMKVEVEQTILRFIDLARQMEAFFLQKRFLLSALKPEMIVKEDVSELRAEMTRKDELIRRHYDKIAIWQNLLADLQGYAKSPAQGNATPTMNNGSAGPGGSGGSVSQSPMSSGGAAGSSGGSGTPSGNTPTTIPVNQTANPMMVPNMSTMQQQLQQQQLQQIQQQQQQQQMQQMHQQQMQQLQQQMQVATSGMSTGGGGGGPGVGPGMVSPQQAMFMQQQAAMAAVAAANSANSNVSGGGGAVTGPRGGPFSQQGPGGVLQGPLAYLEKTTSNIDNNYLEGMSDGRR